MKYYLIKATPRIKDIIEFNQIDKCKSCVELTEKDIKDLIADEVWSTSNEYETDLCKKLREVLK